VPGTIIERVGRRLYNVAYYIDSAGRVLGRYCKVNLWVAEKSYMTRGRSYPVFRTRWGKAGLAICWDLGFPEPFRAMARQGADTVFCPSCWSYEDAGPGIKLAPDSEVTFVNSAAATRAFENEMIVVFSNVAGRWQGSGGLACNSMGCSQVAAPFIGQVRIMNHNREGMFVQRVDSAILRDAESAYEIRADIRHRKL
jgi:predicted amidohydrolase